EGSASWGRVGHRRYRRSGLGASFWNSTIQRGPGARILHPEKSWKNSPWAAISSSQVSVREMSLASTTAHFRIKLPGAFFSDWFIGSAPYGKSLCPVLSKEKPLTPPV